MSIIPSKISSYIRTVGEKSQSYFFVYDSSGIAIDATNFLSIEQGNPNLTFAFDYQGYYGAGYLKIIPKNNKIEVSRPRVTYPIKLESIGKVNVYLRIHKLSREFYSEFINK